MSMFRQSNFDKLIEKATSHILMEPDWPTILQICDQIRQNDIQPKYALNAVKKKLASQNPHTAMYALQLLESLVKNCGTTLHDELTTSTYCEALYELLKNTEHENVRQKMLELIQAWTHAFRKNPKHSALKDIMNTMKAEGYKFPQMRETDAMFTADSAPVWSDGEVCHRCRTQFTMVLRKHHCRACGQVFCNQCSSKTSTLPKFGIEKEVRVCDACYDLMNKPTATSAVAPTTGKDPEMEDYRKSSLAQQSQVPAQSKEDEMREEEELQLAIALSQSEAEHKEKEKMRVTAAYYNNYKDPTPTSRPAERSPSPEEQPANSELARYLNRTYWENRQTENHDFSITASPSAPAKEPSFQNADGKIHENGIEENEIEDFAKTLKSQVEIFINRMKSNSSRGRSIANDSSVQTLFLNITAMHSKLLRYIQQHDDSRLYYERLQDKLTQVKDARAALDALREEHREKLRRQAEEAERQRQMLMAHKLDIMRKKKQEYLQYQRQVALQRIQEQEREMQMRQEQQKQQYMMGPQYYMGSPVHGQQFPPNSAPNSFNYQYASPPMIGGMGQPPQSAPISIGTNQVPPQAFPHQGPPMPPIATGVPPQGMSNMPPNQSMLQNMPAGQIMPPGQHLPPQHGVSVVNMQYQPPPPNQQPGAPPASPQMVPPHQPQQQPKKETQTAELISFD